MNSVQLTCIIDDDEIFVFGAKRMIELTGISRDVVSYNNAEEALKALSNGHPMPDLILLDLNMPNMDGFELIKKFKTANLLQKTSIYIVSSSIDPLDIQRLRNFPEIKDYISKPLTTEKLESLLK